MSTPAGLPRVASKEALDWIEKLRLTIDDRMAADIALQLAAVEANIAQVSARLILAELAKKMVQAVAVAVRTGVIPPKLSYGNTQALITTGMKQYDPRVAFQAALRSSYGAGRYERAMRSPLPLMIYRSMQDSRVRPTHQALDGVALPKNHPFWSQHTPPLGWRCRCRAYAIDGAGLAQLKSAGQTVRTTPPKEEYVTDIDRLTGEPRRVPISVEPGWGRNPRDQAQYLGQMLENRIRLGLEKAAADALAD